MPNKPKGKHAVAKGSAASAAAPTSLAAAEAIGASAVTIPLTAGKSAATLVVDGLLVEVTRKRMQNVRLRVKPDGTVAASAPYHVSDAEIERFVREKHDWIRRQQQANANSPAARAAQATPQEIEQWRAVVKACVPPLVEAWEPIMGVKVQKLAYRNMTSRWGSCQPSTGRVCINIRLALYPPECLEYVVVHELCHLLEGSHGPRFKQLMDTFMPDWRDRERKLNPH